MIEMQVYSQYKAELMRAIDERIEEVDACCVQLTQNIYQYSEERVNRLSEEMNVEMSKLEEQKQRQKNSANSLNTLKDKLQRLKEQNHISEKQIKEKTMQLEGIDRKIMFLQQKNKEDKPHVQPYLQQKERASKTGIKIQYAQQKLVTIQEKYRKQCEEVEYKERLIKMMKDKLRNLRDNKMEAHCKQSKEIVISHQTNSIITEGFGSANETEPSHCKQTSIISTFRS